jgi:hypothetical protein
VIKTDCLSILQWYLQQPDDQGGMCQWSLKEKNSGLYLSVSVDGTIQAAKDVYHWDVWPSPPPNFVDQSGFYQ